MATERPRILIVDDDERIRTFFTAALEALDLDCSGAAEVTTAAQLLRARPHNLVLLDINMPGKTGTEYLPELLREYPDIAVIMITSVTDLSVAVKAMQEGAYDFIAKPVETEHLRVRVARALEKRTLVLREREDRQALEQMVGKLSENLEQRRRELGALNAFFQKKLSTTFEMAGAFHSLKESLVAFNQALDQWTEPATQPAPPSKAEAFYSVREKLFALDRALDKWDELAVQSPPTSGAS